ncbi:hypothetical protein ACQP0C_17935 [Nocardia sp. CA-129566]|uniref:hypothetical protein n=1 Tax=Nocardia sp. CA-129566 TaxID=3239976 RepID=UPI003D95ACF2
MRIDPYAESPGDAEEFVSPFAGLSTLTETAPLTDEQPGAEPEGSPFEGYSVTESPFGEHTDSEADAQSQEAIEFLEALYDEEFTDALEQLLDEGAARILADAQQWTVTPSEAEARESLQEWMAPLVTEWEHAIDAFASGLENADLHGLTEQELDELLDSLETPPALESEAFESFFGKLIRKAKSFIKRKVKQAVGFVKNPIKGVVNIAKSGLKAVKSGLQTIGKFVLGPILAKLKAAGRALLKGVVKKLLRPLAKVLPAAARPLVPILAKRLGIREADDESTDAEAGPDGESGTAAELAEAFDQQLLELFRADTGETAADEMTAEELLEADSEEPEHDPVAELDDARARLAAQLSAYTDSADPIAEIEQFIPAVLAIRPLLKLGLKVTGARPKLINLIARPLAKLIKKMIGPQAARTIARAAGRDPSRLLARAVVDVGFTALGLETAGSEEQTIPGEALASAVEASVMRVLDELPDAAMTDPLQVSAAVQRAFAESAAAYLPDRLLRADLPERETAEEGGFWVMMPRAARPRYRFRKYTRVFVVPIPRQVARAVPWNDGGTMETYLLDRGVDRWPVQAEIDLYETLPGTLPGHFTRDETLPAAEHPTGDEYQPLTAEAAGLLLREPALGRRRKVGNTPGAYRPVPGQRYFRVRVAGLRARRGRRPRRLVIVRWDPSDQRMRIVIRMSERRARSLQARLQRAAPAGQRDLPAVLSALREIFLPRLHYRIARRLLRATVATDAVAAARLAGNIAAATSTGIATYLAQRGAQFAAAVADPADGVTLTVTFTGIQANPDQVPAPEVVAAPGLS